MKKNKTSPEAYFSAVQLLLVIAISMFVIHFVVMFVLNFLPHESLVLHTLLDSALLVLFLSPILYLFLFRPLLSHISKREKFEEALIKERDRAQSYLDIAGTMIVVLDTEKRVALINRKGSEILGYEEEEILGRNWIENFIPEKLRDEVRTLFAGLMAGRETPAESLEGSVLAKDGSERTILWHNSILQSDGRITGTLSSGEDITEQKLTQKALKKSETRYRLVHNTAFDGIIISDADDHVMDCNPSAAEIFGYERSSMLGMDLVELMPEKYRARHLKGLSRFLETGKSAVQGKVLELEGLRSSGEAFPIELIVSSFEVDGVINFTGSIRDITGRRKAEKEKELIQAQLTQSQKLEAVGRLGGGIAHDFNNILTAIRGNAELVLDDIDPDNPLWPRLEEIILSVEHASKLTRQLLLFSRDQPFELLPLNINETIENLLKMLERLISEDVEIITELVERIWTVEADEVNIEQVVMNLAVNARDAMDEGGRLVIRTENVTIDEPEAGRVPNARAGRAVCLTVKDNGIGMDPETISRIFEPFYSTKEAAKGTGLGLAVVYGIVSQHNGWITVESVPGKGTAFRVFLPALTHGPREAIEKDVEAAGVVEGAANVPGGNSERILLVEDEQMVREVTSRALVENGYVVFTAEDAAGALEVFDDEGGLFDIILSDVVLTDLNGVELAKQLIRKKPGIKILLTSGYMDDKSHWNAISGMGFKFLQKPYSLADLLKTIDAMIESD